MSNNLSFVTYFILFIPWILSLLFADYPTLSYVVAWFGSFFIFYITLSGQLHLLPEGQAFATQLLRPLVLVQLIFAGYMSCTSIFYFIEVWGNSSVHLSQATEWEALNLTARCQRYYCLAHAAFVSGILFCMPLSCLPKYRCNASSLAKLIFNISLISIFLSYLFSHFDGLTQFSHQLNTLSFIAGTLALSYAIKERLLWHFFCCLLLYGINFYLALISGFKEPIILSLLVLAIFLYPTYRKTVIAIFLPLLLMLFIWLPTYNRIFREQAWLAGLSVKQAGQLAFSATFDEENTNNNWSFFTNRLSEIHMFTGYVQSTPQQVDYYGLQLIQQSLLAIVPRVAWPSKPISEALVMERVYRAGVIDEQSKVSAKPAFIVDAYLSAGVPGIFICLFSYGALIQFIANKAETLFGGYPLGLALIFTGLFQVFWRGQSCEFLINSVFWSYISMYLIFFILRFTQILNPA